MNFNLKNKAFLWFLSVMCTASSGWSMDPAPDDGTSLSLSSSGSSAHAPAQPEEAAAPQVNPAEPAPTSMNDVLKVCDHEYLDKNGSWFELRYSQQMYAIVMHNLEGVRQGSVPITHEVDYETGVTMNVDINNMNIDEFFAGFLQACIQGQLMDAATTMNDVKCEIRYRCLDEYTPRLSSRVLTGLQFDSYTLSQSISLQNLTNLESILLKDTVVYRFPFQESQRIRDGRIAIEVDGQDAHATMLLAPCWFGDHGINDQLIPACENGGTFFKGWGAIDHLVLLRFVEGSTFRLPMSVANSKVAFQLSGACGRAHLGDAEGQKTPYQGLPMIPNEMWWHAMHFVSPMDCLYLKSSFSNNVLSGAFGFKGSCVSTERSLEDYLDSTNSTYQANRLSHEQLIANVDKIAQSMTFRLNFYDENGCLVSNKCHVTEQFRVEQRSDDQYAWTGVWDIIEDGAQRRSTLTFGPIETRNTTTDGQPYTNFPSIRHFQLCLHTLCLDLLTANLRAGEVKLNNVEAPSADMTAGPAESSSEPGGSAEPADDFGHPKDPSLENCDEID